MSGRARRKSQFRKRLARMRLSHRQSWGVASVTITAEDIAFANRSPKEWVEKVCRESIERQIRFLDNIDISDYLDKKIEFTYTTNHVTPMLVSEDDS